MQVKVSPIFSVFQQKHGEAKELFLALVKQMKSKKSIELLGKLNFLELYVELLSKIHLQEKNLPIDLFSRFIPLQKNLRKIHHLQLIINDLHQRKKLTGLNYGSYENHLEKQKKDLYTSSYDMVLGSSIHTWDEFFDKAKEASQSLKPLAINTGINQLIQEELESFHLNHHGSMDTSRLKVVFKGLKTIIMLENVLIYLGFNPIYIVETHQEIEDTKNSLKPWYSNHLAFQSLSFFLGSKEEVSKKYLEWMKDLNKEKKSLTLQVESQAVSLFNKILL